MNYLISLAIGLGVGLLYGALNFRSPAPPAIALVGLLGMLAGEKLWPMGKHARGWLDLLNCPSNPSTDVAHESTTI